MRLLCRTLAVAPSGYYAWCRRPPSPRAVADARLMVHVRAAQLVARGRRRYRVTTDSTQAHPVAANLGRRFAVAEPNRVWAADITALPTPTGWCSLAVVLDLASRRVVGWATATTLATDLVRTALQRAVATRSIPRGLVHHSDRGSQYASDASQRDLAHVGIIASMSRVGDCWDNAPVASFFSRLQAEATPATGWGTPAQAESVVADHVEFYNRTRLHSAIGYRSPNDYEADRRATL